MALRSEVVETSEGPVTVTELSFPILRKAIQEGKAVKDVDAQFELSLGADASKLNSLNAIEGGKVFTAFKRVMGYDEPKIENADDVEKKKTSIQNGTSN